MNPFLPTIDHLIHHVGDRLDEAASAYARAGFIVTARSRHPFGSSNHLVVFGDDYLEILGRERGVEQTAGSLTAKRLGLMGLVLKPPANVSQLRERLSGLGVDVDDPFAFSRPAVLENGETATAAFEILFLPPSIAGDEVVFFCEQKTPEFVWRRPWQQHANGTTRIEAVVFRCADPGAVAQRYRRVFPDAVVRPVAGGMLLQGARACLHFLEPAAAAERLGQPSLSDRPSRSNESPRSEQPPSSDGPSWWPDATADAMAGAVLAVRDPARTAGFFAGPGAAAGATVDGDRILLTIAGLRVSFEAAR